MLEKNGGDGGIRTLAPWGIRGTQGDNEGT